MAMAMNEGTPLLVAHQEESKSGTKRARAGTYLIIFIAGICFIHLGLDCGLPISSASGQDASHAVSTAVVSGPCCHSGSQEGRRATEAIGEGLLASPCIPCPGSSSGSGSSLVAAYDVFPSTSPPSTPPQCPPHPTLPHSNYAKNIGVQRWPAPKTPSGSPNWYRDDCGNDNAAGPYRYKPENRPGKGQGLWRRDKGAIGTAERNRRYAANGETATSAHHRQHTANGETSTSARHRQYAANGETAASGRMRQYATAGGSRHADEVLYTERHGFPRASRGDGFGNLAHAFVMMQQQHIRTAMWPYELTGSTGTVEDLDIQLRRPIVHTLYDWMQPSPLSTGSQSLQVLLRHMGQRGLFMVVDCEFVSPQRLSADHDIDIDLSDLPSVYARIYDLAIIICDADGNVVERVFHERSVNGQNQAVPFATTATGRAQLDRAVHILGTYRREAKRVWWGNPENALGRLAKLNLKDDGIDARQGLLSVMPWCKPSRTNGLPFSTSQNLIVPYLGLRIGPLHQALPDTIDEAVTITALLRGLNEWYATVSAAAAPAGGAASSTAAAVAPLGAAAPMAQASTNTLTNANAAFAAAFQSASSSAGPIVKKQKTGVEAVSKKKEAKSLPSVASFFTQM